MHRLVSCFPDDLFERQTINLSTWLRHGHFAIRSSYSPFSDLKERPTQGRSGGLFGSDRLIKMGEVGAQAPELVPGLPMFEPLQLTETFIVDVRIHREETGPL